MRRLFLLFLALPTIALAADKTAGGQFTVPVQAAHAAAPVALAEAVSAPTGSAAAAAPEPADCRMSCAQTFYFCRAGDDLENSCAPNWSQCVATCASPDLTTPVNTTP